MEDRLIQIIQGRHLVTWKERDGLNGVACGDLKMVFQHNDEIVIISELDMNYLHEQGISEYLTEYDKGYGYMPYGYSVDIKAYHRFMHDMQEINGDTVHGAFKDVIGALANSGVGVDKEVRLQLEYLYEKIGEILKK